MWWPFIPFAWDVLGTLAGNDTSEVPQQRGTLLHGMLVRRDDLASAPRLDDAESDQVSGDRQQIALLDGELG